MFSFFGSSYTLWALFLLCIPILLMFTYAMMFLFLVYIYYVVRLLLLGLMKLFPNVPLFSHFYLELNKIKDVFWDNKV